MVVAGTVRPIIHKLWVGNDVAVVPWTGRNIDVDVRGIVPKREVVVIDVASSCLACPTTL